MSATITNCSDIELTCSLDDGSSLPLAQPSANLSFVGAVVHEQDFELGGVGDGERLESVSGVVPGHLGVSATDGWHGDGASEPTTHAAIDTDGFAPGWADTGEAVRLESLDLVGVLLLDLVSLQRSDSHDEFNNNNLPY